MLFKSTRYLAYIATFLALVVIILGAYTRLKDAGLGCPDWPGCYGFLTVPQQEHHIAQANEAFPERPVEAHKAWPEMVHRYFAGSLGALILVITVLAWTKRQHGHPVKLATFLLLLVIFQAALGMWTVTMKLNPLIVMAHLLGGFATFVLLGLLSLRLTPNKPVLNPATPQKVRGMALVAMLVLVGQIALGGWTSANYASVACVDLPLCQEGWQQIADFGEAFTLADVDNHEYGALSNGAKTAIHISHRIGAIITLIVLSMLAFMLYRRPHDGLARRLAIYIGGLLLIQFSLGIANVVYGLPLWVATAHNGVAALLLLALVVTNFFVRARFE